METILKDINDKIKLLDEFQKKQKVHSERCVRYQVNRMNTDPTYKKKLYDASREYQRKRYNEDEEFRLKKLQHQKDLYNKKKLDLQQEKENKD